MHWGFMDIEGIAMFGPFGAHGSKAHVRRSPRRRWSGRLNIEELEWRTLLAATGGLDLANVPVAGSAVVNAASAQGQPAVDQSSSLFVGAASPQNAANLSGSGGSGTLNSAAIAPPGSFPTAAPALTDPLVGIGSPPILVSPLALLSPLALVSPLRAFDAGQQSGGGDNLPLPTSLLKGFPMFGFQWQAPGIPQESGGYLRPISSAELEDQGQPYCATPVLAAHENLDPPVTPAVPVTSADPAAGAHVWGISLRQARDVYFLDKSEVPVATNQDVSPNPVPAEQADAAADPVVMAAALALVLGGSRMDSRESATRHHAE